MRYSMMTDEVRRVLLEDPEGYPLKVAFLGKASILTYDEVTFLRKNGVDFDVDDGQAREILMERAEVLRAAGDSTGAEALLLPPSIAMISEEGRLTAAGPGILRRLISFLEAVFALSRILRRLFRG